MAGTDAWIGAVDNTTAVVWFAPTDTGSGTGHAVAATPATVLPSTTAATLTARQNLTATPAVVVTADGTGQLVYSIATDTAPTTATPAGTSSSTTGIVPRAPKAARGPVRTHTTTAAIRTRTPGKVTIR